MKLFAAFLLVLSSLQIGAFAQTVNLGTADKFAVLGGSDVAAAVVQAARDSSIEHVVVGEMAGSTQLSRLRPSVVDRIIDGLPGSDVHVIAKLVQ